MGALPRALAAFLVGAGAFLVYLPTGRFGYPVNSDAAAAMVPAWSVAQRGTLDIVDFFGRNPWYHQVGDAVYSDRLPGVFLPSVPAYAVMGDPDAPTFFPGVLTASILAAVAIALLFVVFDRLVPRREALLGAGLAAFGTCTWAVSADTLWPHAWDQLWLAAALLALQRKHYWLVGASFALAVTARPHLAAVAFVVGVWAAASQRRVRPLLAVGIPTAAGLVAVMLWNRWLFGELSLFAASYQGGSDALAGRSPGAVALDAVGLLASPERGILVLSPFLVVLALGIPTAWRSAEPWVRSAAVGGLLYLLLNTWGYGFTAGNGYFGYRYALESLTLASPLLLLAYRDWVVERRGRRIAFAVTAWASVAVTALGATVYTEYMGEERRPWSTFGPGRALTTSPWWETAAVLTAVVLAALLVHRRRLVRARS